MNNYIFIFAVVLFIFCVYRYIYDATEIVTSTVDGKNYKVRKGPNKLHRANMLAVLHKKLGIIVDSLNNDPEHKNKPNVHRLVNNWNKGVTIKEIGHMESDAAYVINKQYMSFCLDNVQDNANLLTYVGIHELSHIMSGETGHGPEFVKNFEFLLDYSKTLMYESEPLYISLTKTKTPDNYCGVPLANSIA